MITPLRMTTARRSAALTTMETGPVGDFSGCQSNALSVPGGKGSASATMSGLGATRGVAGLAVMTTVIPSFVTPYSSLANPAGILMQPWEAG